MAAKELKKKGGLAKKRRRIQAIVFDFDGLILDTEFPDYQAWQEIYEAHGCSLSFSDWAIRIGSKNTFDPYSYLETQMNHPIVYEEILSQYERRFSELVEAQPVLPGVRDYIADSKRLGLKLGLASNSSRDWVTHHLSRLGLINRFDCIKCADDVKHLKPDPEMYLAILAALDFEADQVIALEDSPPGVMAAKRAGLFCVAVPNTLTRQLSLDQADLQLPSLRDLPLEKLLLEVNGMTLPVLGA